MAIAAYPATGRNIAHLVYGLCGIIIAVFALSSVLVLRTAGAVAEDVRRDVEQHLVRNEIDRQIEILVRDQLQISHWDETVRALGPRIDEVFALKEIANWLWDDFGIQSTIIVSPDGQPVVTVFKDSLLAARDGLEAVVENRDMITAAQSNYRRREASAGGKALIAHPARGGNRLFVTDIRMFDGQLGLMVAQAIIPDSEAELAQGPPHILLTFKPLGEPVMAEIGEKLGLANFQINPVSAVEGSRESLLLEGDVGKSRFQAVWSVASPMAVIWERALPLLLVLLAIVAAALLFVAVRYGRALSALQTSEEQNRFLALHDALTGLPNRLQFDRCLEEIVSEGVQDRCAILCLDMDRFKAVNDTYGHQAGDVVIKTVAERIATAVGKAGLAARIGGDEFIILLRDDLDRDHVLWLCDTVIESVCGEIDFEGGSANVGASIGVAWWPDDALTAKNVIRSADEALYRAKENGRGQACLASGPADEPSQFQAENDRAVEATA